MTRTELLRATAIEAFDLAAQVAPEAAATIARAKAAWLQGFDEAAKQA